MYKWFVWSAKLQKYLPVPGLFPISRGAWPAFPLDMFGHPAGIFFSIPMFNRHNPAYFE